MDVFYSNSIKKIHPRTTMHLHFWGFNVLGICGHVAIDLETI